MSPAVPTTGRHDTRVSVILPLYRPGPGLADSLARLAATIGELDEVLVVDDGTPAPVDRELAQLVGQHLPTAFFYATPAHGGVAAARNDALRHATGRYVWFVEWNDSWELNILDMLVTHAEAANADVTSCRADVVDDQGRLVRRIGPAYDMDLRGQQHGQELLEGRLEGHLWNKLFRRRILPVQPFGLTQTQSDLFDTAPVLAGADRVVHVGEVLYQHRIRTDPVTTVTDSELSVLLQAGHQVPAQVTPFLDDTAMAAQLSILFRHRTAYLTAVTALRFLPGRNEQAGWVQRSRESVTVREALSLLRRWPTTAARSLALLGLGPAFRPFYRGATALRSRVSRQD